MKCHTTRFSLENGKDLLTVRILEPGQVYQCGSNVVMLRIPQGSAVVTLDSQNGEYSCCTMLF